MYLLRTPSSCLLRACCCTFMLFPSTAPRLPAALAGPPREPEPGLCDPLLPPGFLVVEFPRSAAVELVLLVPACGLQSVLSILSTGRRSAGGGGGREGRRGRGWSRAAGTRSAAHVEQQTGIHCAASLGAWRRGHAPRRCRCPAPASAVRGCVAPRVSASVFLSGRQSRAQTLPLHTEPAPGNYNAVQYTNHHTLT